MIQLVEDLKWLNYSPRRLVSPEDLYCFQVLLVPWAVKDLKTLSSNGLFGTSWHDGDTFSGLVDTGLHGLDLIHIRCGGYNAAEITGTTKPQGLLDADYARSIMDTGKICWIRSVAFASTNEEDDFGRMLGYVTTPSGEDLAYQMVANGHGVALDPESSLAKFKKWALAA